MGIAKAKLMISIRAMEQNDIPRVSEIVCACYEWLRNHEGYSSELIDFLVEHRGSQETIRRESK